MVTIDNGMSDPKQPNLGVETFVKFEEPVFQGICLVIAMIYGSIVTKGRMGLHFFKGKFSKFKKYATGVCNDDNYKKAVKAIMDEYWHLVKKKNMHKLRKGEKHDLKKKSRTNPGVVQILAEHYGVNVIVFTKERNWAEIVYTYPGLPFDVEKPFVCLLQTTSFTGSTKIGHIHFIRVSK